MAAGPWVLFGNAIEKIADSTIQLELGANNARVVLVTDAYTPDASNHDTYSDLSGSEASGTGYVAGGEEITITVTRSGTTVTVTSGNVSWANSSITAKYAAIVMDADANGALVAGDLLLCYCLLDSPGGANVSTTNGTFAVNMNGSGIFTIAPAA
jgi:hypothetical protein